jgi:hypothetical protein
MGIAFGKYNGVTCCKTYRRVIAKLDVATTFRNEMEDNYSLSTRFKQRCGCICAR